MKIIADFLVSLRPLLELGDGEAFGKIETVFGCS